MLLLADLLLYILENTKNIISKMLIDKCSFDIDGSYLSFCEMHTAAG